MPVGAAIGGAGILGAGASIYAANKQSDASSAALNQQYQMYQKTQADLAPYKKVGSGALISLGQLYGIDASGNKTGQPFNESSLGEFYNSPDYKFAFNEGNRALTFSNAAKGLLQSGSNLKDIVSFGQGVASTQLDKYINRLYGLANMGQNSAAGGATNALGFASAMGGTTMAGGQAAASGAVGAANALTGGVGSYLNYNQQQQNNAILQGMVNNKAGGNNAVTPWAGTYGGGGAGDQGPTQAMMGLADGGRPPVGRPVMVGERGPEVFVPDQPNQDYGRGGESPWHGNGWQGSPGMPPNGLAAFSGLRGLPGGQPNGLANAWGGWANMLRPLNGGQPNGLMTASQGFGRPVMGGLPGFADGGRPPVGGPAVVGEQGPEIFVPDRPSEQEIAAIYNLPPELRAEGIAKLKLRMGGEGPWYMQKASPRGAEMNKYLSMSDARYIDMMVPRRMDGYADGGRPPVGEPIIVGENGPEVVQMDQPGTVVPNHELPLWLESGMEQAPPYSPPMTRAVDDYSTRDPNELATMRMRGSVRPDTGRADFPINHLANMATAAAALSPAGAALAPEYLAARAATMAPRVAAGGIGAMAALSPTVAGEQEFKWADLDQSRTKEIADILNRVNGRSTQITTLGTTKTNSPAGTQASTIKALEALNHPEGADMKRLNELRKQASDDRQSAQEQWQFEQDRARQQAEAKRKAETSWFDVVPGSRSLITPVSMAASYAGGKWLGNRYGMAGATAGGAIGGGVEGFLGQFLPTEIDYAGLPETSPAYQKAERNLDSLDWWKRVGLISAGNAALGAYGGFKGVAGRRPILTTPPPAGPSLGSDTNTALLPPPSSMGANPALQQNGLAIASQAPPSPQISNALANLMTVKDKNGRTIYMNRGGGFANKADIDRYLNSKASQ